MTLFKPMPPDAPAAEPAVGETENGASNGAAPNRACVGSRRRRTRIRSGE
jgi:hypothetical protein